MRSAEAALCKLGLSALLSRCPCVRIPLLAPFYVDESGGEDETRHKWRDNDHV
ncbi:hypothetical protein BDZ89DRAFT_1062578, partial [Hymenopellis radicata]